VPDFATFLLPPIELVGLWLLVLCGEVEGNLTTFYEMERRDAPTSSPFLMMVPPSGSLTLLGSRDLEADRIEAIFSISVVSAECCLSSLFASL
jgi:hypothetical protein